MFIMLVKLVIQLLVASKRHVELVCTAYYPSNPFFLHGFRSSYFLMLFMIHNIYLSYHRINLGQIPTQEGGTNAYTSINGR
jgi:hypothetical protein